MVEVVFFLESYLYNCGRIRIQHYDHFYTYIWTNRIQFNILRIILSLQIFHIRLNWIGVRLLLFRLAFAFGVDAYKSTYCHKYKPKRYSCDYALNLE